MTTTIRPGYLNTFKARLVDREEHWIKTDMKDELIEAIRDGVEYLDPKDFKRLDDRLGELHGSYELTNASPMTINSRYEEWRSKFMVSLPDIDEPKPLPLNEIRVTPINRPGQIEITIDNPPTVAAQQILMNVLPEVLRLFLAKNKDYGDEMGVMRLGPKGQFVDIWRKVGKLKGALWDGKELAGEQVPEIMMDLIGHLLLALNDMDLDLQAGSG